MNIKLNKLEEWLHNDCDVSISNVDATDLLTAVANKIAELKEQDAEPLRPMQILDALNVADAEDQLTKPIPEGQGRLILSNNFVSAQSHPAGGTVTMGISRELLHDIILNPDTNKFCILLIVDKAAHNELEGAVPDNCSKCGHPFYRQADNGTGADLSLCKDCR